MTDNTRMDRIVSNWLAEKAQPTVPDWFDEMLEVTARTPQRRPWAIPERWIPMTTLTRVRVPVAPFPWRTAGLIAALLLLLAAALLTAGARRPVPAPPFGPAANGVVAYANGGDIYAVDPATGVAEAITTGPAVDGDPVFSRDGTRIAFSRIEHASAKLVVTAADGSGEVEIPVEPVASKFEFSPDGTALLALEQLGDSTSLVVAPVAGGQPRSIADGMTIGAATWLPPHGREILFVGTPYAAPAWPGLYVVDAEGGRPRELVAPAVGRHLDDPAVSPDGTRVAYMAWQDSPYLTARLRLLSLDGGAAVEPAMPEGVVWQGLFRWSNDGESLVLHRGYTGDFEQSVLAVVPASDPASRGVETRRGAPVAEECCASFEWAPDDSVVLVTPVSASGMPGRQMLLDPETADVRPAPWDAAGPATWQRRAP